MPISNVDNLFALLAKPFALCNALDGARTGEAKTKWEALQAILDDAPEVWNAVSAKPGWFSTTGGVQAVAAAAAEMLCLRYVEEKNLPRPSIGEALNLILDDMAATGRYCTPSNRLLFVDNGSDLAFAVTDKNGLAEPTLVLPEQITGQVEGNQVRFTSQARRLATDPDWPGGSEIRMGVTIATPAQSLLANADFELVEQGAPSRWLVHTGTIGQTVNLTEPEQQQVAITGSPTGGYYVLCFVDWTGRNWETPAIAYNATASAIQTALRSIPVLGYVTVTGTNPYTITFEQTPGNINQLTAINRLTGGTSPQVQITTTRQGDAGSYWGRSLKLTGTGSEQTLLFQTVRLRNETVYALFARAGRSASATGTLRFELRRGLLGAVCVDPKGTDNRIQVSIGDLPVGDHEAIAGFFRLSATEEQPVTFALHVSSPLPAGQSVYLDQLCLVPAVQLYPGGPYVAVAWSKFAASGGTIVINAENDYAGKWEKAFDRWLQVRERTGRALPTTGTVLIPDSLLE